MNIFYWSIAHLMYSSSGENVNADFYNANKNASIAFVVIICAYSLIRFFFNKIGGLYMFKRIICAGILGGAVYHKHGYLAILLGLEVIFTVTRYLLEKPKTLYQKIFIFIEWIIFSIAYVLMFVVLVTGVTAFICTAIIFIMIVILMSDLLDVYLGSECQYSEIKDSNLSKIGEDKQPESSRNLKN